jgi:penicillin-binding protein 1C
VTLLVALGIGLTLLGARLGLDALVARTQTPDLAVPSSTLVLDRQGHLLRPFTVADGRWRLPIDLAELDPTYVAMLLACEDHRFHDHSGVDPLALARAGLQLLTEGRIVSGGSTITMQLARLLTGANTRDPGGKLNQALRALALERRHDKAAILTAYLTLAPYGGNLEGVRAASLAWLGKEPRRLTPAEAALLVALPQAPEARRPDRDPQAARRARDRVLDRALAFGVIDAEAADAARAAPVPTTRRPFPLLAPHLTQRLARGQPSGSRIATTLDRGLQGRLEQLAGERAAALGQTQGPGLSLAILAADHGSGEVLASVGSAGLFDAEGDGYIDMTRALRSPGSTLKPLIYGLAFEAGIAHPEGLIEDTPSGFGGYVPTNFDRHFQGTVSLRRALQLSLNVPAVKLLEAVGPVRLVARLRRAGANPVLPDLSPPGLAIGLGGVGVSLRDLVQLFAAIARGGAPVALREGQAPWSLPGAMPVLEARAAWTVADILAGAPAPAHAAPGALAFKTGTSYGYRDAWAIGFDGRHVAGVWVGRPDGAPVPGLAGIEAAAPILVDIFARLGPPSPLPAPPPGILTAANTALPPPLRRFEARAAAADGVGPEIAYPPNGARIELDPGLGAGALTLKVRNGTPPFTWFANGTPIGREPFARTSSWAPDGPGFVTISVVDGRGGAARVAVFLD